VQEGLNLKRQFQMNLKKHVKHSKGKRVTVS